MMFGKTELYVKLKDPKNGYWDGGPKDTFTFSFEGKPQKDKSGYFIRVGSWSANFWFNIGCGKTKLQTEKEVWGNVIRKFKRTYPTAEYKVIENENL